MTMFTVDKKETFFFFLLGFFPPRAGFTEYITGNRLYRRQFEPRYFVPETSHAARVWPKAAAIWLTPIVAPSGHEMTVVGRRRTARRALSTEILSLSSTPPVIKGPFYCPQGGAPTRDFNPLYWPKSRPRTVITTYHDVIIHH